MILDSSYSREPAPRDPRWTPLRPTVVAERLGPGHRFSMGLHMLGVVDSTSDLLLARAKRGAGQDGAVVVAEAQRRGRGRRGHRWNSPARRGLWLSVLLHPAPSHAPSLAAILGLALAESIEAGGCRATLKWPNDVLVQDRKVGGCIVDITADEHGVPFAVCGVGLNVNSGADDLPTDPPWPASSLWLATGQVWDRESLLVSFLDRLQARLAGGDGPEDLSALAAAWKERDALLGRWVQIATDGKTVEGRVTALDPIRSLTLETEAGLVSVRAETAHILTAR